MFLLAGAAASVLEHLGSLQAASSMLQSSAGAGAAAAASGPAFDLGSSVATDNSAANPPGDGANRSSPATMDALISMQGGHASNSTASSASSINLLERMIAQHAQLSTAASVGHSFSTFV
jgi:hypothetical protein